MLLRRLDQVLMVSQELGRWFGDQNVEFTLNGVFCDRIMGTY